MFSNDQWPKYKPSGVTYPEGVSNSKLPTKFVKQKKYQESFNIHQGILFDNLTIFIFFLNSIHRYCEQSHGGDISRKIHWSIYIQP